MNGPMTSGKESKAPAASLPAPAWRAGTVFAVLLHAGLAGAIVYAQFSRGIEPEAPAAIAIDLAPMVSAPPEPETALPEGPREEEQQKPEPPEPEPDEVAPPKPVLKPPTPRKREVRETTAPRAIEAPVAERKAAPVDALPSRAPSNALPTYQQLLLGHLERYKRYPRAAQRRAQEGMPYVTIRIDRQGSIVSSELQRGSGHEALDRAALETVERASPVPPLPPEIAGETLLVTVPMRFTLD